MRVLVTGGSGFVGSHVVAALLRDGHRVRVFARQRDRVSAALAPLSVGADDVEVVEWDLSRPASFPPALDDMEAVVHAASVYSLDPRDAVTLGAVNREGSRMVLEAARDAGLDPIVHLSSLLALLPSMGDWLGPDTPPGRSDPANAPYCASKAAQEQHARELQDDGAPVVTVMPGGVWGPNDPYDGESVLLARSIARRQVMLSIRGGLMLVDVRDVAEVVAAVVAAGPGRGSRRYAAGGTWQTLSDLHREIGGHLGRRLATLPGPPGMAMGLARAARWSQRRIRTRLPVGTEQVFVTSSFLPSDDRRTTTELGITFRPVHETIRDQLVWQEAAARL